MATITSAQSGNWSATTTWVGGVLPADIDDAVIAAGHTVTLDATSCICDRLFINGTLSASSNTNTRLSFVRSITNNSGGRINIDVSTNPAIFCELLHTTGTSATLISSANGAIDFILRGAPRKRWTRLSAAVPAGATSAQVSDTTGWRVGDIVVFGTTDADAWNTAYDTVTLTSVSGNTIGWSGGLAFAHRNLGAVGNMTSNMIIRSSAGVSNARRGIDISTQQDPASRTKKLTDVLLTGLNGDFSGLIQFLSTFWQSDSDAGLYSCAIYDNWGKGPQANTGLGSCGFEDNVLFTTRTHSVPSYQIAFGFAGSAKDGRGLRRNLVMRYTGSVLSGINDQTTSTGFLSLDDNVFNGCANVIRPESPNWTFTNCEWTYCPNSAILRSISGRVINCRFRRAEGDRSDWPVIGGQGSGGTLTITDGLLPSVLFDPFWTSSLSVIGAPQAARVFVVNRNGNVNLQEVWTPQSGSVPTFSRDNSISRSGSSSMLVSPRQLGLPTQWTRSVPCASGQSIRVVGYVRMDTAFVNGGDCNLPTVTLSGLGATPVTFTATATANTWQMYDLSITNTSGFDGNFTLTFSASAKTVATGNVWFDGVPDAPFITKVRHYGFTFDETNPVRRVNIYTQATESVAAAYTGMTINPATKRVSFGAGTIDTFSKLYDYSQAWGMANIAADMPWTRAGQLLSLSDGWTVVDPQIQGMTWGGGTIEFNNPGFIEGSFDGCAFNFNAAGTYDISAGEFAGTIELNNTSAGGVLVVLIPANIDYINNSPGTITVQPVVQQATAQVSGVVSGSRLQVFNQTTGAEIANVILTGTSWSLSYPDGNPFSAGDVVRVRLAYQDGAVAKIPAQYRTVATPSGWSILADQQDDVIYNTNAIDGDTCTEFTHDFANVQVDVSDADGFTTPQRGYAWYIAGQMTADGIRFFHGGIDAIDAANYRINVGVVNMRIQNILPNSHLMIRGARLFRSDGSSIFSDHASGASASHDYGAAIPIETGVSGLTAAESDALMQSARQSTLLAIKSKTDVLPLATEVADAVWSKTLP